MKKPRVEEPTEDRDTMRPEYDFSDAVRGVTAARYAQGTNVVVIDPEVLDDFPDGASVNDALRALTVSVAPGSGGFSTSQPASTEPAAPSSSARRSLPRRRRRPSAPG